MSYNENDKKRSGKGGKSYRRKRERLKERVAKEGLKCTRCGHAIDVTIPFPNPLSFTADHPIAVANGGHIHEQELEPMHHKCNASKGNRVEVEVTQTLFR